MHIIWRCNPQRTDPQSSSLWPKSLIVGLDGRLPYLRCVFIVICGWTLDNIVTSKWELFLVSATTNKAKQNKMKKKKEKEKSGRFFLFSIFWFHSKKNSQFWGFTYQYKFFSPIYTAILCYEFSSIITKHTLKSWKIPS